jgi:hypothetical protein
MLHAQKKREGRDGASRETFQTEFPKIHCWELGYEHGNMIVLKNVTRGEEFRFHSFMSEL